MHNFFVNPNQSAQVQYNNLLTIERGLNAANYNVWVPAKDIESAPAFGTPPAFYQGNRSYTGEPAHWELPKSGGSSRLIYYTRRMPEWHNGVVYMRAHYSVDIVGGLVVWGMSAQPVTAGAVPTTNFTVVGRSVGATPLAMETVDLVISTNTIPYCSIDKTKIGAIFCIDRRSGNASDTCAGDVRLYGIELIYKEGRNDAAMAKGDLYKA